MPYFVSSVLTYLFLLSTESHIGRSRPFKKLASIITGSSHDPQICPACLQSHEFKVQGSEKEYVRMRTVVKGYE